MLSFHWRYFYGKYTAKDAMHYEAGSERMQGDAR